MGILSLDRSFNTLGFSTALPPRAGLAAGIITSGVSNIDGRDNDGRQTGSLAVAQDEAYLSFGIRFPAGFSVGVSAKLLYAHLYTDMTSTTAGFDLGAFMPITEMIHVGFTIRDIGSKYKWDSTPLYQEQGMTSEDHFPQLYTLGVEVLVPDSLGIVSADIQASNQKTLLLSLGAEYPIIPELAVRAGIDRIDLKYSGMGVRPAFGFMVRKNLGSWTPVVQYTYVVEPFAPSGIHMISVSAGF